MDGSIAIVAIGSRAAIRLGKEAVPVAVGTATAAAMAETFAATTHLRTAIPELHTLFITPAVLRNILLPT